MGNNKYRLCRAPLSLKILVTCLVLSFGIGYGVALGQVYLQGSFDVQKTIGHFRGDDSGEDELKVRQSDATMVAVAHVHTFSQPILLFLRGVFFLLTGLSERAKGFWIILSFVGSLAMNAGPWLIRDVSPHFVHLLSLSGGAMALCYSVMSVSILRETWWKKEDSE